MVKQLTTPPPSSSVARFLEPGVGSAALTERHPHAGAESVQSSTGETPHIKREFILTRCADDTLAAAVRCLSRATGTQVSNSHFLRAVLTAVAHALPDLEREAYRLGRLKRPGNARGTEAIRAVYEQKLAEALIAALGARPAKD